jgi:hypothetical protein
MGPTGPIYTPYTGFANVPNVSGRTSGSVGYETVSNVALFVYIESSPLIGAAPDTIFVPRQPTHQISFAGGSYWPASIYVNGEIKDVFLNQAYQVGTYSQILELPNGLTALGGQNASPTSHPLYRSDGTVAIGSPTSFIVGSANIDVRHYDRNTGAISSENLGLAGIPPSYTWASYFFIAPMGATVTHIFIDVAKGEGMVAAASWSSIEEGQTFISLAQTATITAMSMVPTPLVAGQAVTINLVINDSNNPASARRGYTLTITFGNGLNHTVSSIVTTNSFGVANVSFTFIVPWATNIANIVPTSFAP